MPIRIIAATHTLSPRPLTVLLPCSACNPIDEFFLNLLVSISIFPRSGARTDVCCMKEKVGSLSCEELLLAIPYCVAESFFPHRGAIGAASPGRIHWRKELRFSLWLFLGQVVLIAGSDSLLLISFSHYLEMFLTGQSSLFFYSMNLPGGLTL